MIGIVLWSDPHKSKAVFWCEDHGDLAYYTAEYDEAGKEDALSAGDLVQFDAFFDAEYRRAVNPCVIQENAYDGLDRRLHNSAQITPIRAASRDGQVVPFRSPNISAAPLKRRGERV